jgi:hypothetical protein
LQGGANWPPGPAPLPTDKRRALPQPERAQSVA